MLKALLKWENPDATSDLNARLRTLVRRGIYDSGLVAPVVGQLNVDIQPFLAISNDGMTIIGDATERVAVLAGQTNVVTVKARYQLAADPIIEYAVYEVSVFNGLADKDDHIVFAYITLSGLATQVTTADISYIQRDVVDPIGRFVVRGTLTSLGSLPSTNNRPGDAYIVTAGTGDLPSLNVWNGTSWLNITDTLTLASLLAQHRANMFVDEKHLTDDEKDAALGSFGSPDALNPYVTSTDPRVPTQSENDALQGDYGTPSGTNRFVTEEYPIAQPTQLLFPLPPGGPIEIIPANGPVFVGTGAIGSANTLFSIVNQTENRGFINALNIAPAVIGVFKDALLTMPMDPSADADADGFYTGSVYLETDSVVDAGFRLAYGQKQLVKTISHGFPVLLTPADDYTSSQAVEKIVNIKGRPFTQAVPTREQNINLRVALDALIGYLGSSLNTNIVAADDDYRRLSLIPVIGTDFVRNIGVPITYHFDNVGLTSFSYNAALGRVTYGAAVDLSLVVPGDRFIDGAGTKYRVDAVNDGSDYVDIVSVETGDIPQSIVTSVGSSVDGSIIVANNPRDLLLSEMKLQVGSEVIPIRELRSILDEFTKPEGKLIYGILRGESILEPRLYFAGAFENYEDPNGLQYVRCAGTGEINVTDFMTDVAIWIRKYPNSPDVVVSVNDQTGTTVSTSNSGNAPTSVGNEEGPRYQRVLLASGLSTVNPTNISAKITTVTGPLDIYAIEIIRSASASDGLLETGRAFQGTDLIKRDNPTTVTLSAMAVDERGGRQVVALGNGSYSLGITTIDAVDISGCTANNNTITVPIGGAGSLSTYRVNDLVRVDTASGIYIRQVTAIVGLSVTIDGAPIVGPIAATLRHLASLDSTIPNVNAEDETSRLVFVDDFQTFSAYDLRTDVPASGPRFALSKDGNTMFAADAVSVVTAGISGAAHAIRLDSGSIRLFVTGTRLDLVSVNTAAAPGVTISIDGSAAYPYTFGGGGATRTTVFFNSRHMTHEVVITGGGGLLALSEMLVFGPLKPVITTLPVEVADLQQVGSYSASSNLLAAAPQLYPLGAVFYDFFHHISYVNGVGINPDWSVVNNQFSKTPMGRYVTSTNDGASAEFYFLGDSFELQFITGPDHGIFAITVDGTALESTGASIIGDYTGNQVDAYSVAYGRLNIGAQGFTFGYHKVVASIKNPRTKNVSSSDYKMGFVGYWVGSTTGLQFAGVGQSYGFITGLDDIREFLPIELPPPVQVVGQTTVTLPEIRKGTVSVGFGATSQLITFASAMPNTDYVPEVTWINTTDAFPQFQPVIVTAFSTTDMTVTWNAATATGNYILRYKVEAY